MGGVDLVVIGDQIEAGDNDLVPPDDGLAGLVQLPLKAVGIRGDRHAPHGPVGGNAADGVGGEVGDIDVAVLVDGHAVGGFEVGGVLGPDGVLLDASVPVEGDLVDGPVPEITHIQIPLVVKDDAVHTVLAAGIFRDKREENVGIGQCVGAVDALGVQREAVDAAHQVAAVGFLPGHAALGDVHIVPPDADSVGMLHVVGHNGALDHALVVEAQAQDAARVDQIGPVRPAGIVHHIEVPVRTKLDPHRAGLPGIGILGHVEPLADLPVPVDLQHTAGHVHVGKIGAG